jgi:elongation factor Ts
VAIAIELVKTLRSQTGAGVLECQKALEETGGDMDKACEVLRKKGLDKAAKKATREAKEGIIGHYIHMGAKVAALIEVNCESDFVARTDDFQTLVHDLAMQVVAASPLYVRPEDVPADVLEYERNIYRAQMVDSGKPAQVVDKIVEGKLKKYFEETCLLNQPFIKDGSVIVGDLIAQSIARMGENIVVRRFVRYAVGE